MGATQSRASDDGDKGKLKDEIWSVQSQTSDESDIGKGKEEDEIGENERIIVYDSARHEVRELKEKPKDFEKRHVACDAPGRAGYVPLYYWLRVGEAEAVKIYFATANLGQLGWSAIWDRLFNNNIRRIWLRRSPIEQVEIDGKLCLDVTSYFRKEEDVVDNREHDAVGGDVLGCIPEDGAENPHAELSSL